MGRQAQRRYADDPQAGLCLLHARLLLRPVCPRLSGQGQRRNRDPGRRRLPARGQGTVQTVGHDGAHSRKRPAGSSQGGEGIDWEFAMRLTALTILFVCGTVLARGGEWPRFLGPDGTGVVEQGENIARSWPAGGPRELWKINVGSGFGGAAI